MHRRTKSNSPYRCTECDSNDLGNSPPTRCEIRIHASWRVGNCSDACRNEAVIKSDTVMRMVLCGSKIDLGFLLTHATTTNISPKINTASNENKTHKRASSTTISPSFIAQLHPQPCVVKLYCKS